MKFARESLCFLACYAVTLLTPLIVSSTVLESNLRHELHVLSFPQLWVHYIARWDDILLAKRQPKLLYVVAALNHPTNDSEPNNGGRGEIYLK